MRFTLVAVSLFLGLISFAHAAPPPEDFFVDVEGIGVLDVVRVEPHSDSMVALWMSDGTTQYVPMARIRRVTDSQGVDWTSRVRRGKWIGAAVLKPIQTAEETKGPETWKKFRLRAGPKSQCGSYMITDFTLMKRSDEQANPEESPYGVTDLGYAKNVWAAQSVGCSAFFGYDGMRSHAGIRVQTTRWITPKISLTVAPGAILAADEENASRAHIPGFIGRADLGFVGRIGLTAQVFTVRRDVTLRNWMGEVMRRYEERETAAAVGIRLGGGPGIAGSAAFLVYGATLLGSSPVYVVPAPYAIP